MWKIFGKPLKLAAQLIGFWVLGVILLAAAAPFLRELGFTEDQFFALSAPAMAIVAVLFSLISMGTKRLHEG
ncbi:MAG: hypothetical protein V1760_02095 [Candidatus Peregrinibacteria bacterium]